MFQPKTTRTGAGHVGVDNRLGRYGGREIKRFQLADCRFRRQLRIDPTNNEGWICNCRIFRAHGSLLCLETGRTELDSNYSEAVTGGWMRFEYRPDKPEKEASRLKLPLKRILTRLFRRTKLRPLARSRHGASSCSDGGNSRPTGKCLAVPAASCQS